MKLESLKNEKFTKISNGEMKFVLGGENYIHKTRGDGGDFYNTCSDLRDKDNNPTINPKDYASTLKAAEALC